MNNKEAQAEALRALSCDHGSRDSDSIGMADTVRPGVPDENIGLTSTYYPINSSHYG